MPDLDDAIKTLLKEHTFLLSEEENKMSLLIDKEMYGFLCEIQAIVEDFTECQPLTKNMLAYLIVGLASKLADINNPNDLL